MEEEYEDYLSLTQRTQTELLETIDELRTLEGWDADYVAGLRRWAADEGMVFRALRRNHYDTLKTSRQLLNSISQRVKLSLHLPIPSVPPYSTSSLFYFLPPTDHLDRNSRPIAVLNISQVKRDDAGSLDSLREWVWWMAELSRRLICDWENSEAQLDEEGSIVNPWEGQHNVQKRSNGGGRKGSGYVLIVDATGAGYRNLELELVPTLLDIGHGHFPGLISRVIVVNLSWTQKHLWGVIQRILPKYALQKIWFPTSKDDLATVVDLSLLPQALGGSNSFCYDPDNDIVRKRYSRSLVRRRSSHSLHASRIQSPMERARPPTRSGSLASIADIFLTPASSPLQLHGEFPNVSRRRHRGGDALRMTIAPAATSPQLQSEASSDSLQEPTRAVTASPEGPYESPIQRIKSLSNFHLYLSSSRLANIDLLADSDDESERPKKSQTDGEVSSRGRRHRPALRCVTETASKGPLRGLKAGKTAISEEHARSYSTSLQRHHARGLRIYSEAATPVPAVNAAPSPSPVESESHVEETQPIAPFASNQNPWFGYPAIRVPDSSSDGSVLRPRYSRNRKRDLVKTLLFLFVLRMQSFRAWLEKALGIRALYSLAVGRSSSRNFNKATGPVEGLQRQSLQERSRSLTMGGPEKDWLWMAVGFLLLRGGWARMLLLVPLEFLLKLRSIAGHS